MGIAKHTLKLHIKGLVQGVGFRPYIFRLAHQHNIKGWVENRNDGVIIEAQAANKDLERFVQAIYDDAPQASHINSIDRTNVKRPPFHSFEIVKSSNTSDAVTEVSPDIMICNDCLEDLHGQTHRINYPLTNCTNCGPRFTIIRELPYDRDKTTMSVFPMCETCNSEYTDILDRRFHAQPVACLECGPKYSMFQENSKTYDIKAIVEQSAKAIESGEVMAIKGMGGYHLACDAFNESAVSKLRNIKSRDGKPFAVMFRDSNTLKEYASLNDEEEKNLTSWQRPIVLVKTHAPLAYDVSVGFETLGVMLPYMAFHYMLFDQLTINAIVLTSGNISDEPIIIDDQLSIDTFGSMGLPVISYNRGIHNRCDDSVSFLVNEQSRLIRRSRSFVPSPIHVELDVNNIVAVGAELVNCFCIGKHNMAIMSQHIGDLKNIETLEFFTESLERFKSLFRVEPELIVCDMHPDYMSTRYAEELNLPLIKVQHHHAHIASTMLEHGLDEKVIGIALDGVGLGDDNKVWGGEFMIADLLDYERFNHFEYIKMPGGDQATKHPWRMAVAYLHQYFGRDFTKEAPAFLRDVADSELELILRMLEKNINCPETSSTGRLFDAVSALLGLCIHSSFHAEAPMRLENIAATDIEEAYPFSLEPVISLKECFHGIGMDLNKNITTSIISAKFHNTLINIIFAVVKEAAGKYGINKVALSGGSFQNRILLGRVERGLRAEGFEVYSQLKVPSNDGGLALGQLAIAAKRRSTNYITTSKKN